VAPKKRKPAKSGIQNDAGHGLPQITRIEELDQALELFKTGDVAFQKMLSLKDMPDVNMKVQAMI
jgi:hypothetical protein